MVSFGTNLRGVARSVRQIGRDVIDDLVLIPKLRRMRQSARYRNQPARRILIVGVQSVKRGNSLERIFAQMTKGTRHTVATEQSGVGKLGKLANTNALLAKHDLNSFDWVIMTDDDVTVRNHFMDDLIFICEANDIRISGPAHRAHSYKSHTVTFRQTGALARETNFVEIGPVVAVHRSVFDQVFPLPDLKFGWGAELPWSMLSRDHGVRIGIIDGQALRHWGAVATTYRSAEAMAEMEEFKRERGIVMSNTDLKTIRTISEIA
jgi:hypothetical protein